MRKPLFYLLVPLVLASKICQILMCFLETFLVIVFSYFCVDFVFHFWTRSKSSGVQKGAHFGIVAPKRLQRRPGGRQKYVLLLVPFLPAAVLTPPPPPRGPRAALLMDLAHISTSLGYLFPHFFRFRTQGKNQSVEAENIV